MTNEDLTPFITLKVAQTIDGRIATRDGSSKWLSGEETGKFAHLLRSEHDAVLVGINTVIRDNPLLNVRLVGGKSPIRVVVDSSLRLPEGARVISGEGGRTIVATTNRAPLERIKSLKGMGLEVMVTPDKGGRVDLGALVKSLRDAGIKGILVEGGGEIATSFLREGLVNQIVVVIVPKIMGKGIESVKELNVRKIDGCIGLELKEVKRLGQDLVYIADVRY